jgi:transposase
MFGPGTLAESSRSIAPRTDGHECSTAPQGDVEIRRLRVTHPYHPLFQQEFELVSYCRNWGEDRVWFQDKLGRLHSLPTSWTDAQPGLLVRVVGQAALKATVYELEKLRCNLCSDVFTAKAPEGVGAEKYDETSASMIALLKYGSGLPFHRLERLQGNLGIPLPAATQWEIVKEITGVLKPAYQELIRQAAQGEVVHNDDTTMKILAMMPARGPTEECAEEQSERTGVFTSGIVSTREGRKIALFFTGRKHAGENLAEVLSQRASELGPPIQMCDALSRNPPKEFQVILAKLTASRMEGASLSRWPRTFPRNAVMCWSSCARSTRMTRLHGSKGCHPNSAYTFIRSRADRG